MPVLVNRYQNTRAVCLDHKITITVKPRLKSAARFSFVTSASLRNSTSGIVPSLRDLCERIWRKPLGRTAISAFCNQQLVLLMASENVFAFSYTEIFQLCKLWTPAPVYEAAMRSLECATCGDANIPNPTLSCLANCLSAAEGCHLGLCND